MKIKATFNEIAKRLTNYDTSKKIFKNGANNDYTETMEAVRNNSVTASMASEIMVQYLIGKGFGEFDNYKVGNQRLIDIAEDIAKDLVNNRGCYIQVNYNYNYKISDFKVLPFNSCRIGQKDSFDYNGKIYYKKNWIENKGEEIAFDVFNPNEEIVKKQFDTYGKGYRGQIMFYSMDRNYIYPLHRLNAVSTEADNESQASIYKNTILRQGFYGKTLIITRPLIDDDVYNDTSEEGLHRLREQESERDEFKKTINNFIGADNAGGSLVVETEFEGEDLNNAIVFKNIESNISPDLFQKVEDTAVTKILMAYNNLPIALVKSPDSAMLGNSGEAIREAKKMYWENTNKERNILETIINDLWELHQDFDGQYKSILKLIEDEPINNNSGGLTQL